MIKIVKAFVFPLLVLMFIWLIIGYQKHGADILNMHLDLEQTLSNLTVSSLGSTLTDNWFEMLNKLNEINSSALFTFVESNLNLSGSTAVVVKDILSGLRAVLPSLTMLQNILSIIFGLVSSVIDTIAFIGNFIGSIISFIFNPVFV